MLQAYDKLKNLFTDDGYEVALKYVEDYPINCPKDELLQTNFYCFLTIQRDFKHSSALTILQGALAK